VPEDAFAFSPDPAGREPWNPDTMTHRYRRYARRVGINSSLKELRNYSATQLLAAGTDLNTVAGRLGHAEGSTTLKFYAQFTRPADQPPPPSSPPSSTASARRNASASCTSSACRLPAPTS
jgi:integrase